MNDREDYYPGAGVPPTEQHQEERSTTQEQESVRKPKKPVYKRWWFWVMIVCLVCYVSANNFMMLCLIAASVDEGNETPTREPQAHETAPPQGNSSLVITPATLGTKNNPYIWNADTWYSQHCAGTTTDKYLNKWVKVSGTVLSISDYGSLKGYYLSGSAGAGLVCWVEGGSLTAQYGQQIEYVGKVTVEDSRHIELSEGQIKTASWPTNKPKSPVTISEWTWTRDYLGGVEWNFKLTNNTNKTVKYVTLEWYCYNAVGDMVYDDFTGKSNYSIVYTGPLEAGKTTELLCNTTRFYNQSYNSSKLSKFTVEFTDGTIIRVHDQGYTDILIDN